MKYLNKSKIFLFLSNLIRIFTGVLPNAPIVMWIRGLLYSSIMKKCGKNLQIASNVIISSTETATFGKNVYIGPNCVILGPNIKIGHGTLIGPNSVIVAGNHLWDHTKQKWSNSNCMEIILGKNTWIGANCTILGGSIIPDNSIVAAGSVYNLKSNLENSLFAGVPAKFKKNINQK